MSTTDTRTSDVEEVVDQIVNWNVAFSEKKITAEDYLINLGNTLTSFREKLREDWENEPMTKEHYANITAKAVADERERILALLPPKDSGFNLCLERVYPALTPPKQTNK